MSPRPRLNEIRVELQQLSNLIEDARYTQDKADAAVRIRELAIELASIQKDLTDYVIYELEDV